LANYPSLVVATVPSPRLFTVTAGPGGTIASQTIANPAGAKGFVYVRQRLGRAQNGVSQIFENATATNASLYLRSESGDAYPSGTVAGNQSVTIGTTAPIQLAGATAYQYSWSPTNEFRITPQADRTQWSDQAIDALSASNNRLIRNQVCPDLVCYLQTSLPRRQHEGADGTERADRKRGQDRYDDRDYYHRRCTQLGDQRCGSHLRHPRSGCGSLPNLTTATAVTVTGANTFTVVIGTASTVTLDGGHVAKVQGGNLMSALGVLAQVVSTVSMQTLPDGTRQLAVVGSGTWAGIAIGDLVNWLAFATT
jgi:hypothetical protein